MSEIKPDTSDESRCISVHWSLPVQCVLPCTHPEIWHESWHPESGNNIRYRRSMGVYVTEEERDGDWHDLQIPPPGGGASGVVLTDERLAELNQQFTKITETFDTPWQACEDFGDVSVRTADSMPGFYTEVFRTTQLMGHDGASPVADFLINTVNRLPELLAEVRRLQAKLTEIERLAFMGGQDATSVRRYIQQGLAGGEQS